MILEVAILNVLPDSTEEFEIAFSLPKILLIQ